MWIIRPGARLSGMSGSRSTGGGIIEAFGAFANDSATNKTLHCAQLSVILGCHKTDCITHRVCPARTADAMHIILLVHWEIIIYHVRNVVHVDTARRDVRRYQHAHRAGFKVF